MIPIILHRKFRNNPTCTFYLLALLVMQVYLYGSHSSIGCNWKGIMMRHIANHKASQVLYHAHQLIRIPTTVYLPSPLLILRDGRECSGDFRPTLSLRLHRRPRIGTQWGQGQYLEFAGLHARPSRRAVRRLIYLTIPDLGGNLPGTILSCLDPGKSALSVPPKARHRPWRYPPSLKYSAPFSSPRQNATAHSLAFPSGLKAAAAIQN